MLTRTHLLILPALLATAASAAEPTPAAVEEAALKARRDIRTCYVVVKIDSTVVPIPGGKRIERNQRLAMWRDGDKLRVELNPDTTKPVGGAAGPGSRVTLCKNCLKQGFTTSYIYLQQTGQTPVDTVPNDAQQGYSHLLFDPRVFGYSLVNYSNYNKFGLESVVGSKDRKGETRVERVKYGGQNAWLVRATTLRSGGDLRIWVLPDRGNNVAKIEVCGTTDEGKPRVTRAESDLQQDPVSGVWFPKKVEVRQIDGDHVTVQETFEIERAELNRRIDPKVFTLAGMDVPIGTKVKTDSGKFEHWDGGGTVKESPVKPPPERAAEAQPPPEPVDPLPSSMGRVWYVVTAVLFAGAAVLLLRRAIIRRG